jgi:hypothetical protein
MLWAVQELQDSAHERWLQPHVDQALALLIRDMQV